MKKVLLILADGMCPDSLAACKSKMPEKLFEHSFHTLKAKTVFPSLTLPCHMSLMHSVLPERHGILSNTYVPQVHPIDGLFDVLSKAGLKCGFFYTWEELRDLSRPGSLEKQYYIHGESYGRPSMQEVTDQACKYLEEKPDFCFLYLGATDDVGHKKGWMTPDYLDTVKEAFDCMDKAIKAAGDDYTVIITADHGGHDRMHGLDIPEDMTIPLIIYNKQFGNKEIENVSIMDIAPTICSILNVRPCSDWDGRALKI